MVQPKTHQTASLWDKIWKDKTGKVVLFSKPNLWLTAWLILKLVAIFATSTIVSKMFSLVSDGVLIIWSLLEVLQGVNYFRRALGLAVLLLTIASAFRVGL